MSGYSVGMELDTTLFDQGFCPWQDLVSSNYNENANEHTTKLFELCRGSMVLIDTRGNYIPYAQSQGALARYMEHLCFYGADINSKDVCGKTPLHIVAENGFDELAEVLVKQGAFLKVKDRSGETPLHVALRCRKNFIVSLLLDNDKQLVYEKDNNGNTPLHVAVQHNVSPILVKDLLESGAMFMILHMNNFGQDVTNIAETTNNTTLYQLLLDCILANPSLLSE